MAGIIPKYHLWYVYSCGHVRPNPFTEVDGPEMPPNIEFWFQPFMHRCHDALDKYYAQTPAPAQR